MNIYKLLGKRNFLKYFEIQLSKVAFSTLVLLIIVIMMCTPGILLVFILDRLTLNTEPSTIIMFKTYGIICISSFVIFIINSILYIRQSEHIENLPIHLYNENKWTSFMNAMNNLNEISEEYGLIGTEIKNKMFISSARDLKISESTLQADKHLTTIYNEMISSYPLSEVIYFLLSLNEDSIKEFCRKSQNEKENFMNPLLELKNLIDEIHDDQETRSELIEKHIETSKQINDDVIFTKNDERNRKIDIYKISDLMKKLKKEVTNIIEEI